jgi:beta-carotene 3-hydroxylase
MSVNWLEATLIVIATTVGMELVAFLVHKYWMHGPGWEWHRSHHEPASHGLEKNDLYALFFAGIAIAMFWAGALWSPIWWVGVGMTTYGLLYALAHDGLVHRRFPVPLRARRGYLKRLVQAHRLHHAVHERTGAVSFGFLYAAPPGRLKRELRALRSAR